MNSLVELVLSHPPGEQIRVDIRRMGFRPKPHHPLLGSIFGLIEAEDWIKFALLGAGDERRFRSFAVRRARQRRFVYLITFAEAEYSCRAISVVFTDHCLQ